MMTLIVSGAGSGFDGGEGGGRWRREGGVRMWYTVWAAGERGKEGEICSVQNISLVTPPETGPQD